MADSFDAEVDPTGTAMLLLVPDSSPLLEAAGFLGWTATPPSSDGAPRKAASCAAAAPLLARCRLGAAGPQLPLHPTLLALCPLTFALTGAAWSRVLTALGEAGLFEAPLSSSDHLLEALAALEIADLSPFEIGVGDLLPVESTAPQAAVAAQAAMQARRAGAGRGATPARPARVAVPARSALHDEADLFLHATVGLLEDPGATLPWKRLASVLRLLGACHRQDERNRASGDVRAAGRLLRQAIATRFSLSLENPVLVQHLGEYMDELSDGLPAALRDDPLAPRLCLNGLRDALEYREGGEAAQRVEERRFRNAAPRYPNLFKHFLSPPPSGEEALERVGSLIALLLPGSGSSRRIPFHVSASRVEQALLSKLALLEAQAPGGNAEANLAELRRHSTATGSTGAAGSGAGGAGSSSGTGAATAAFEAETLMTEYIALREAAANMQTDRREDRLAVLDLALQPELPLPRRILTNGERDSPICRRDVTLSVILSLLPFLSEWFTLAVATEPDGTIPRGLEDWSITGDAGRDSAFLKSFLAGDWATMDWYGTSTTPGLCYYLSRRQTAIYTPPKPEDWFCVPSSLRRLADFGQRLFSALGYPATVEHGHSFQSFIHLIIFYLEKAPDLPTTDMAIRWVDDCDICARQALALAAQSHKLRIGLAGGAPQPPLGALLPEACAPIQLLKARSIKLQKGIDDERDKPSVLQRGERATVQLSGTNNVPLRSARPQRLKRLRAGDSEGQLCLPAPAPGAPGEGPLLLRAPGEGPLLLRGDGALALHAGAELPPGTRGVIVRRAAGGHLQVGGRVWRTGALALAKGERPEEKCFGLILSRQRDDRRQHLCLHGMQGAQHASFTSQAHVLKDFDFEKDAKSFSRFATPEEQAEYNAKFPTPDAQQGKRTIQGFRRPTTQ